MEFSIACFELEEFETALKAFEAGQKLIQPGNKDLEVKYNRAIRKCRLELEGIQITANKLQTYYYGLI